MNCYRCSAALDLKRDVCPKCGADTHMFKKIVYASNRYYNEGLIKARARDLTGARESLRRSLQLYKKNIPARNLLGLVEYGMGEYAEALKNWLMSRDMATGNNMANRYIGDIKRNMRELDSAGHGITKFNQALNYARNNARDLAVIQLKKVVSVHSNMTKAYELLALLYIDDRKYGQARKMLERCLDVDRGNTTAISYLKELDALENNGSFRSVGLVGDDDREQLIIPVRFRDFGSYLSNAIYVLLGIGLGILISWFVIVPGRVGKETAALESRAVALESQISDLQARLQTDPAGRETDPAGTEEPGSGQEPTSGTDSPGTGEEPSGPSDEPTEPPTESQTEPAEPVRALPSKIQRTESWTANQRYVSSAVAAWNNEDGLDHTKLADFFYLINPTILSDVNAIHYLDIIKIFTDINAYDLIVREGDDALNAGDRERAMAMYRTAALLKPDQSNALYKWASVTEESGDTEAAAELWFQLYWLFQNEEVSAEAETHYLALTGEERVPNVPEDTDLAAYKHAYTPEELYAEIVNPAALELINGTTEPQG